MRRYQLSRLIVLAGAIVGLTMVYFGLTSMIPQSGAFGVAWTLMGGFIAVWNLYALLRFARSARSGEAPNSQTDVESRKRSSPDESPG